jgi:hypothetical protein
MAGSIEPNAEILIDLAFKPKETFAYETEILFETQVTKRVLQVFGQGTYTFP